MEITRKIFWAQAAKGGVIIGLVMVGLGLLKYAISLAGVSFWGGLVSFISVVVFIMLVYAFTKKISSSADPSIGFSYGRCIGFVLCMMLFVGLVEGLYSYVMNNFVSPETVREAIDSTMILMQDLVPAEQFDMQYAMMNKFMFSLFWLVFINIFGYVIYGVIVGLVTSVLARRNPEVFPEVNQTE